MYYPVRSTMTGQISYVGDGIFSSFGNFLSKTVVGKALGAVVSLAPGGSKAVSLIKKGTGVLANVFEKKAVQVGAAAAGGAVVAGTAVGMASGGGGAPALPYAAGTGGAASPYAGGAAMPDILDPASLSTYYRAPKGYVIVRNKTQGTIAAVRKDVARRMGVWHPARKPPISAGDWHRYQTAQSVEKKLLKIARHALRRHGSRGGSRGVGIIARGAPDKIVRFQKAA